MWLTEECLFCSSVNHIFLSGDYPAWECWCCLNQHWLYDHQNYTDYDLCNDLVPVLHGQFQR